MPYNPPVIGSGGLVIPTYAEILAYLISQYRAVFGATVYLGLDSADYQDLSIRALQASDTEQGLQSVYLSFNPQTAIGTNLDLLGRLIGTARKAASNSTADVTLTGTPYLVILNGVARDVNGKFWDLPSMVTLGSGGTLADVRVVSETLGPITANPGEISSIATPTSGWTAVTNPLAASPGDPVETDANYRARLLISQTKPSMTLRTGTAAAIAAVSGVTRSVVYENPFGYSCSVGYCNTVDSDGGNTNVVDLITGFPFDASMVGKTIALAGDDASPPSDIFVITTVISPTRVELDNPPGSRTIVEFFVGDGFALGPEHSITCVVEGGAHSDIAQAIYSNRGIGCYTNGSTSVVVTDPKNVGISMTMRFDVLAYMPIIVSLDVHPLTGYTSAVQDAMINGYAAGDGIGIVQYLNSLGIGQSVVYSELFGAALKARPDPDHPLFSIRAITLAPDISGASMATDDVPIDYNVAAKGIAANVSVNLV